jgi:hypothetical protein
MREIRTYVVPDAQRASAVSGSAAANKPGFGDTVYSKHFADPS